MCDGLPFHSLQCRNGSLVVDLNLQVVVFGITRSELEIAQN